MTLRAWFDPKVASDPRQWLLEREVLGSWRLEHWDEIPGKQLYSARQDLRLADGSVLRLSAMSDWTFVEPQNTLTVANGTSPLFFTTWSGTTGLSATIATGHGGFLSVEISFRRHAARKRRD